MKNNNNNLERLLSLAEVAELLGISVRNVYRLINDNKLGPPLKVGKSSRIKASDYSTYIEGLTSQGES